MMDCATMQSDLLTGSVSVAPEYRFRVDNFAEAEWSAMMAFFDDASVYQTWAYGAVRWHKKNLSHCVLYHKNEVVGMAQLRIMRPGKLPFGVAYLRWGPLCQRSGRELDPENVRMLACALHDEYVIKRGLHLEVLPNAVEGSLSASVIQSAFSGFVSGNGISGEHYRTFLLDISPTLEQLRKQLDKKWRNQLSAAERNELTIEAGDDCALYVQFSELYKQMWERKKFSSGVSVEEFLKIQQALPTEQRLQTFICRHRDKPIAGLVCSAVGATGIYLLGATNEDGMKVKGSYLLQWAAIQFLKTRGCSGYDLGGIDPIVNPGVYHFKSGLSGIDVSYLPPLAACENRWSSALARFGRLVRNRRTEKPLSVRQSAQTPAKS